MDYRDTSSSNSGRMLVVPPIGGGDAGGVV